MAVIFVPLMSALWVAVTLSMSSAQPIPEPIKFEPKELWPLAAVALSAVIWISYILKSRRVREHVHQVNMAGLLRRSGTKWRLHIEFGAKA